MVRRKLTINNPTGLHLRPAGLFCKTAMQFQSKITFLSKNTTANAKSVLSVLGKSNVSNYGSRYWKSFWRRN